MVITWWLDSLQLSLCFLTYYRERNVIHLFYTALHAKIIDNKPWLLSCASLSKQAYTSLSNERFIFLRWTHKMFIWRWRSCLTSFSFSYWKSERENQSVNRQWPDEGGQLHGARHLSPSSSYSLLPRMGRQILLVANVVHAELHLRPNIPKRPSKVQSSLKPDKLICVCVYRWVGGYVWK